MREIRMKERVMARAQLGSGIALLAAFCGAAAEPPATGIDGLGMSVAQAVEVCEPAGERRYLARLVCPDQSHPEFRRIGNLASATRMPAT